MKRCPRCNRVETDDALTFCRVDGTALVPSSGDVSDTAGTLRFNAVTGESETSILPTGQNVRRPTAPTTVLEGQAPIDRKRSSPKSRRGVVLTTAAIVAVTLAASAYVYLFRSRNTESKSSIAVLPFQNGSDDPEVEYLSDGISESLINSLSQLPNVRVLARSTMFSFKGKDTNPLEVGRQLGVETVLTGRVIQRGDNLTVQTDLVNVADGSQLWGERYHRKLADVHLVQAEIVRDVSGRLRRLASPEKREYTPTLEAYQLYLKGRFFWNKRTAKDLQKAIDHFQHAIAIDPNYASAYAGLADAYALTPFYSGARAREMIPKARDAALKALSLDDGLAEAHAALGLILDDYDYDFAGAERAYSRALQLNPNYVPARQWHSELLSHLGRHDEAIAEIRRALEIDPLSLIVNKVYGDSLYFARRYDEAAVQLHKTLELDASFIVPHRVLGYIHEMKGNYPAAVEEFAKFHELNGSLETATAIRKSFAEGGWQRYLRTMVDERRSANQPSYMTARFHAALGQTNAAFAELDKAYEGREFFIVYLKVDPSLDPLRSDPRFAKLMDRVGLPR